MLRGLGVSYLGSGQQGRINGASHLPLGQRPVHIVIRPKEITRTLTEKPPEKRTIKSGFRIVREAEPKKRQVTKAEEGENAETPSCSGELETEWEGVLRKQAEVFLFPL